MFGLRVSWENQERATPEQWALVTGGVTGQGVSTGECFFVIYFLFWANQCSPLCQTQSDMPGLRGWWVSLPLVPCLLSLMKMR